jgi:hypothetical protein
MATIKPYLNQSYTEIKRKCLESNALFEDNKFPAKKSSLGKTPLQKNVVWKRPSEICDNPQFIVNSIEPNDIDQGSLGNCWFISAAAAVASNDEYINKVIPPNQSFDEEYAGIFYFRFWR